MTPPVGTRTKVTEYVSDPPPKDFYSPKACPNCHPPSFPFKPLHLENFTFLPSPNGDCTAEIYWPDSQRSYHRIVGQAPFSFLCSQNYLETLLLSRRDRVPLEIKDGSIRLYLGLTGQLALPDKDGALQIAVQLADDGGVCAEPSTGNGSELEACRGVQIKTEDGNLTLPLQGTDLLSGQDLKIRSDSLGRFSPEVNIAKISVRDGRLIISLQFNNPFLNSGVALLPSLSKLPFLSKLSSLSNKISPNPYDPNLYDFDATDPLLKIFPVAYNPNSHEGLSYENYQTATNKSRLEIIPYLFNIVRDGKLPDRLSLNHVYEAAKEIWRNIKKPEDKKAAAGDELIDKLIEKIAFQVKLHPRSLLLEKLYVDFGDAPGKNFVQVKLNGDHLRDWQLQATAPLQINRLFAPDIADLSGQADINLQFDSKKASELRVGNLALQLKPMEYLRENPDKPGLFAILGGSIRGLYDHSNNLLITTPPIQIQGNFTEGFRTEANLRLDEVSLRLPALGNVTISGDLAVKLTVVPRQATVELPSGEERKVTRWIVQPGSLHFSLSNLDLKTALGLHSTGGTIEFYDDFMGFGSFVPITANELRFRARIPSIGNGAFKSIDIDGELPLAITPLDGSYDLKSLAQAFSAQLRMHAQRSDGNQEDWDLKFNGSHTSDKTHVEIALDSKEKTPSGTVKRSPVEDLKIHFHREQIGATNSYELKFDAKQFDFSKLQLLSPSLDFKWLREELGDEKIRYSIPVFKLTANGGKLPEHGDLRGLLSIKSLNPESKPLTVDFDGESHTLSLKNLNLDFRTVGVTDWRLISATNNQISGINSAWRLQGHWKMDYTNFKGEGKLALAGNVHLRSPDRNHLKKPDPQNPKPSVDIPILSKTLWQVTSIDPQKERIKGSLSTDIDPAAAEVFGVIIEAGQVLHLEINHDRLPYIVNSFLKKIEEYLAIKGGGKKP